MHLFISQPTSPVARSHLSVVWDPGDPHWSPKTTIFTPKMSPFSSTAFQEASRTTINLSRSPNAPFLLSTHLTCGKGPCIGHLGPWGPHQSPQTILFTAKTSLFSLAAFQMVRPSNSLSKLPNASFPVSTHLTDGKGPCISHLGPRGPPLEPPNNLERVLLVLTLSESG